MGIELLERAAGARGRILKVERRAAAGHADDPLVGLAYLLTFDVGRVHVAAGAGGRELALSHLEVGAPLPAGLEDLAEEEPWWRVLGHPLCAVWPGAPGEPAQAAAGASPASVCMQFREDDANPKLIALTASDGSVRVSIRERVHVGG